MDVHLEYVQQQVVAELASAESTSPLTPLVIGDFKAYRGKLSDTYVNLNYTVPIFTMHFHFRLRDHVRAMKSVKYVERNQMFHSDVKEMRLVSLDQEMDRNIYPSAEQEENDNVGIAGCLVQYNCPAWVSRKNRVHLSIYMHLSMRLGYRDLYGPPAGLVQQTKIIISIVRRPVQKYTCTCKFSLIPAQAGYGVDVYVLDRLETIL